MAKARQDAKASRDLVGRVSSLGFPLKGSVKGDIDVDVEVDVDIDSHFGGYLKGISKSVEVLFSGIAASMGLTLIILKQRAPVVSPSRGGSFKFFGFLMWSL